MNRMKYEAVKKAKETSKDVDYIRCRINPAVGWKQDNRRKVYGWMVYKKAPQNNFLAQKAPLRNMPPGKNSLPELTSHRETPPENTFLWKKPYQIKALIDKASLEKAPLKKIVPE